MSAISYSQASLFAGCPARYKAERIDGIKAQESLPMKQGSFVHLVVEHYSKRVLETGETSKPAIVRGLAEDLWAAGGHGLPEIVKEECIRLAETTARHLSLHPENVVGVELKMALDDEGKLCPYDSPKAALRGRIDRLEIQDGAEPVAIVWDLKAGRSIDNPKETVQLPLYAAFARAVSPHVKRFIGKFYYPRHQAERTTEIDDGRIDAAVKWALDIRADIEARRLTMSLEGSANWEATPGAACQDCPLFWSCEARRSLSERTVQIPTGEQEAAKMLIRAEVIKREYAEIREMLRLFIEANGPILAGDLIAEIVTANRYDWPMKWLQGVLAKHGLDPAEFLKGDTRKLKRAAVKYPGLSEDLQAIVVDKTHTELDIRRVGKERA